MNNIIHNHKNLPFIPYQKQNSLFYPNETYSQENRLLDHPIQEISNRMIQQKAHNTVQYNTIQTNTIQIQFNTIQYNSSTNDSSKKTKYKSHQTKTAFMCFQPYMYLHTFMYLHTYTHEMTARQVYIHPSTENHTSSHLWQ